MSLAVLGKFAVTGPVAYATYPHTHNPYQTCRTLVQCTLLQTSQAVT